MSSTVRVLLFGLSHFQLCNAPHHPNPLLPLSRPDPHYSPPAALTSLPQYIGGVMFLLFGIHSLWEGPH